MRPEHWLFMIPLRLRSLFRRAQADQELDDELRDHLERKTEEYMAQGMTQEQARRRARLELGGIEQTKEKCRDTRRVKWIQHLVQDIRYGLRALRKSPGFTAVAVLTLALGIGANTAIFSVIESVLFTPLPFSGADQIVRVYSTQDGERVANPGGPSPMDMRDFATINHTFESMVVYDSWRKNVSFGEKQAEPEQMLVGLVSGKYFDTLVIKPIMGRLFTENESYVGKHYVAAISARVWKTRYGNDPAILGGNILINDEPYTIIAVMPDVIPEWMDSR